MRTRVIREGFIEESIKRVSQSDGRKEGAIWTDRWQKDSHFSDPGFILHPATSPLNSLHNGKVHTVCYRVTQA